MPRPDATVEAQIGRYARDVEAALGRALVCVALHGSAAGDDWIAGRSDVNTAIVVEAVTIDVLEALAPVVAAVRTQRFALPLVVDRPWLDGARDAFPMELDDIRRQHRVLAGEDVFAGLVVEREALRRECEQEARGKVLRLRAHFLDGAGRPELLEPLMAESLKSFLVILRHLLRLRGRDGAHGYPAVLHAGEALLGPLPAMRHVLEHRSGAARHPTATLRSDFVGYLADVERIVAALDGLDA